MSVQFNLLGALPLEVQYKVLDDLPNRDLHQLSRQSRAMHHLIRNYIGSDSQRGFLFLSHHLLMRNYTVIENFLNHFSQPLHTKHFIYIKNLDPALPGLLKKIVEKFVNVGKLRINTSLTIGQFNALIAPFNALEELSFDGSIKDEDTVRLEFPKNLKSIAFQCSNVNDQDIGSLPSLSLTDQNLDEWAALNSACWPKSLLHLNLSDAEIDIEGFNNVLNRCGTIKSFALSGCKKITQRAFKEALYPLSLTNLEISHTNIADDGLAQIFARCKNMTELTLSGCRNISREAFIKLQFSPSIEGLMLAETKINGNGLNNIFQQCKSLKKLNIENCEMITKKAFDELAFPQSVTILYLCNNHELSDRGLSNILTRCPDLAGLTIQKCKNISEEAFATSDFGQALQCLLADTCTIDGRGLKNIVNRCRKLNTLMLANCKNIASRDFQEAEFPPSLLVLDLGECSLDEKGLRNIYERCTNLRRIILSASQELRAVKAPPIVVADWIEPSHNEDNSDDAV